MKYLIYFAVTTPLLLAWLLWQTAGVPPPPPMFHSFADTAHNQAVLAHYAKNELLARATRKPAALAEAEPVVPDKQATRAGPPHLERTARANAAVDRNVRLR